ncbi:MAG: twin-arginine translocase subunit TatC [Candidatus Omnitrophica bacterium]|nr:twin-arginine translocase subunit TatC [Candidatus Omnitrophota bacterium]
MSTELVEPAPTARPAAPEAQLSTGDERRVSLTEHLEELRRRLWIGLGAVGLASAVSFAWAGTLIDWLKRPAGARLPRLAFFSPPEAMVAYVKVAITAGLILALPVVLHELWAFLRPGLTARERRYGLVFVWCGTGLFFAGGAFAYWGLLPITLPFLLGFGGAQLEPVISISQYLSFTTTVILACGAVFQLPLAIFLFAKLGLVSARALRRQWRTAVVAMTFIAAIVTPTTDAATLLMLTMPMLALYEVSIWVAALAGSRRRHD